MRHEPVQVPSQGEMMDWTSFTTELMHAMSLSWWQDHWDELTKIMMINIVLSGDNAIVVGLAASRVPQAIRTKVIIGGIGAAVVLRLIFAGIAAQLLKVIGLTLAGGLLLLWVCWSMYRQIAGGYEHTLEEVETGEFSAPVAEMGFWAAIMQITLADVSMSLDNVLAVAGAARQSTVVLIVGLAVAIILMGVASHFIAKLLVRYHWISWIGLLLIVWVALEMIYTGSHEITCKIYNFGCSETLLDGIIHRTKMLFGH